MLEPRQMLTAVVYPLSNAGFEEPDLSANTPSVVGAAGWTTTGSVTTAYDNGALASEGEQYLRGDSSNWSLRQSGPSIEAGRRYLLSLDLRPLTEDASSVSVQLRGGAGLMAGAASFPSSNSLFRQIDFAPGEWTNVVVGFHSDDFLSQIGAGLEVRVLGTQFAVDNVKLTTDASVREFFVTSGPGVGGDGSSAAEPLSGFANLQPYLPLRAGETLLLKAGDVFSEELNLRGKGTEDATVTVTRYGDGPNPILRPDDLEFGRGLVWNNPSYARIAGINVERAKIGFYLRYEWQDPGGQDVLIEDSHFRDLSDPTLDASKHNFEYAWSDAIWVGGQAWNDAEFSTRLDGLTIRNVSSVNAAHLFGTGFYFPAPYKGRIKNLVIEDSVAYDNLGGAFQLFGVDGGRISRVHSIGGGGQDTWSGTTLGFVQNTKNVLIEDSEFAFLDRAQSADGTGMDYEGDTENMTFRNNVVHGNAGSGLLILSTQGRNTNLLVEDNVFYDNAQDPWNSEINSEVQGSNDNHTGIIRNNSFYRGETSINFLSPNSDWSGFQITDNKFLEYEDVRTLATRWEFDTNGDFEGWAGFNDWADPTVIGGVLAGSSGGIDPFVESPPTWANSRELPYLWLRMSQTAGGTAQVFYQTETDTVWNAEKSVAVLVNSDGQMHNYFIDLGALTAGNEIITKVRIDPTVVDNAEFAIDFARLTDSTSTSQAPPSAAIPAPIAAVFNSIAVEDGEVLESAQNSGVGGSVNSGGMTFRLGDDSQNRAYRQFLSFSTAPLPDDAIVVEATLGITRVGNPTGNIPIGVADSPWGDLIVDLAEPGFGGSSLIASDWQAFATEERVSKFAWPAYLDGQTIFSRLDDQHTSLVNTDGRTQFRVRYQNDDDGDNVADSMSYATGNHFNSDFRPTLSVEYYVPSAVLGDYDLSGVVDEADRGFWAKNFGATGGVALLADGNRDGRVDTADYTVWRDQFDTAANAVNLVVSQEDLVAPAILDAAFEEVAKTETPAEIAMLTNRIDRQPYQSARRLSFARQPIDLIGVALSEDRLLLLSDAESLSPDIGGVEWQLSERDSASRDSTDHDELFGLDAF